MPPKEKPRPPRLKLVAKVKRKRCPNGKRQQIIKTGKCLLKSRMKKFKNERK